MSTSQTIPSLTGSTSAMKTEFPFANTDPTTYGTFSIPVGNAAGPNGVPICCGPLLDDRQAASVTLTAKELPGQDSASIAGNFYFQNTAVSNQSNYLSQIQTLASKFTDSGSGDSEWGGVFSRVDGACPIVNP